MNFACILLEYKHELMIDDDEPSAYMKEIDGHVIAFFDPGRERAGSFKIFVVDVELAVNDGMSLFDVFDSYGATFGYLNLYKSELEFKAKVTRCLAGGERVRPNMLILDRMEILPKYRGHGIGLAALRCLQRQFSTGCGIIAMKPFPLQFEGGTPEERKDEPEFVEMALGRFDNDVKRATRKLQAYYARLGFVRVPGTEYMVADPLIVMPILEVEPPRVRA